MKTAPFLDRLRALGVELEVNGDRLRCSAPKGVLTADLRAEMAERKGEIIGFLQQAKKVATLIPPPLVSHPAKEAYPLSFAQQRIWFLHHLVPDQPLYNLPEAVRVKNPLNAAALEQSINEIIRRQIVLRTKFPAANEYPSQVVSDHCAKALPLVDLSALSQDERETVAAQLAVKEARRPFDLIEEHLLRTALLRIECKDHLLLLTLHHLVSDGWSTGILVREIMALYKSYCSGKPSPFPDPPVQYVDYAQWQRDWLQGEVLRIELDYWREALGGNLPPLELPLDRPRPALESFRGSNQSIVLAPALTQELKRFSRQQSATLFITLLSAFKVLLHRLSGQYEITIGTPVAGRNQLEVENLIGVFSNTLVLRSNLSGNPSFEQLLSRARAMSIGAYSHQDLPFEKLVEELHPQRDLSRNPLFQVIFILQNAPMPVREAVGLSLASMPVDFGVALFDLTLTAVETEQGLKLALGYNTELFDATTIQRMLIQLETLLQSIVANPVCLLSEISLLPDFMRHQVLIEWNDTRQEYDRLRCLQDLLQAQAAATPHSIALVFDDQHLSYSTLDSRAEAFAFYLQSLGVVTETPVAVLLDRSAELVVWLIAVLKSGGAYIPLDPSYPQKRMSFILQQTKAKVIVTSRELKPAVEGVADSEAVMCLTQEAESEISNKAERAERYSSGQSLAYIIYTSGSSGEPKGVGVEHSNLTNFVEDMIRRVGMSSEEVMMSITTVMFDIFGLELYVTMSGGGKVEMASREEAQDGKRMVEKVTERGVTMMQGTPTSWRMMIEGGMSGREQMKAISGGEAISKELLKEVRARSRRMWNMYGPTETTIWSSVEEVREEQEEVVIGRGIMNTRMYVKGEGGEEVGIGVKGEIWIGGEGVGRGYREDEEKTAERMRPELGAGARAGAGGEEEIGGREYGTGDIGRYTAEGKIEYIGRADRQVKVRGYRIELGEVEAALARHPLIREAVAIVDEDGGSLNRLACFIVSASDSAPTPAQLRDFLQEQLPEYMIPNIFVALDAIPRTPNGKIDRKKLPTEGLTIRAKARELVLPRTATEKTLSEIWSEVLKFGPAGIHDNFFEVGGHSLLATQIRSRISQALNIDLPLRYIFQKPTIAEQSELIDEMRARQESEEMAALLKMVEGLSDEEVMAELNKRGRFMP